MGRAAAEKPKKAERAPRTVHSSLVMAWWALENKRVELAGELPALEKAAERERAKADRAGVKAREGWKDRGTPGAKI